MLRRAAPLLLVALLACGCSEQEPENVQDAPPIPRADLAGAERGEGGYPTIIHAAPATLDRGVPQEPLDAGRPVPAPDAAIDEEREAEGYFRIFPTTDTDVLSGPRMPSYGVIELRGGCLRLRTGGGEPGPLVVLSRGTRPYVDAEGYLVIADPDAYVSAPVRIGEGVIFGRPPPVRDEALIASVQDACGAGPILWVNRPRSYYGVKLNDIARNAPRVAQIRGVALEEARRHMLEDLRAEEARRRQCLASPVPGCGPGVMRRRDSWMIVLPPPPAEL